VETRQVIKINVSLTDHLNGFDFVVNVSKWCVSTDSGVLSSVVTFLVEDDTFFLFFWWYDTVFTTWIFNTVWDFCNNLVCSVSCNEVPLLDLSVESRIVEVGFS
jgi:hypothetical protein